MSSKEPIHGKAKTVIHQEKGLFKGLPNPLKVGRYHSLIVDKETLPSELEVTAVSGQGEIMGLAHKTCPLVGVQFHPESVLTEHGHDMLKSFLG
jgi:anthranilate synthase/aminodeoxychorismate synthase-like glutamine amidotransferase